LIAKFCFWIAALSRLSGQVDIPNDSASNGCG
jgi:hypothetical protein